MEIPGTERPKIKAIEDAASTYVDARDKRMKLTEKEIECKAKLIDAMQRHIDKLSVDADGNRIYRFDDELVILIQLESVKVKHADPDDDGSDE